MFDTMFCGKGGVITSAGQKGRLCDGICLSVCLWWKRLHFAADLESLNHLRIVYQNPGRFFISLKIARKLTLGIVSQQLLYRKIKRKEGTRKK